MDLFDPRPSALKKTTEADIEELKDSLQCYTFVEQA